MKVPVMGSEQEYVAATLSNLALLYHVQGSYAEAEPLLERALAIVERALESEHPQVVTTRNNLAQLYRAQGKDRKAKRLSRKHGQ